jgi:hypothetical protein
MQRPPYLLDTGRFGGFHSLTTGVNECSRDFNNYPCYFLLLTLDPRLASSSLLCLPHFSAAFVLQSRNNPFNKEHTLRTTSSVENATQARGEQPFSFLQIDAFAEVSPTIG